MARGTLNLGILAHVDAGKTTLTERLLYAAGVIDEVGSVDDGTTQTDSLALERQRGITIKSAVVSFTVGDVTVNLIDTPGHPDFIAEVERALSVLDGAVLVISAVEGVQPQTRILMRALQRLRVPAVLFVNKIDRRGAGYARLLRDISERLTPAIVAMGSAHELGARTASFTCWDGSDAAFTARLTEVLAEHDEAMMAAYVRGESRVPYRRLREELAAQTRRGRVHPVFFGSALTGAGVDALMSGVAELLPRAGRNAEGPASGRVFKIERGPAGEKIAYVRMFSGTVRTRDPAGPGRARKVTAISVFADGSDARRGSVSAGQIGKLWGLAEIQVGDAVGAPSRQAERHQFAPPTLETVVVPRDPHDRGALRAALAQLAEQDPLINVRQDDVRQEISVSLFGEVQKEVIGATLAADFGLQVSFRETTTICIERLAGLRRRGRAAAPGPQSVPGHDRAPRRAGRGGLGRGVPDRGGAGLDAAGVLPGGRGHRAGDPAAGPARLGGTRLHGGDDALRLPRQAQPRPPALQQEHVEHGRGLPQADPAGPDQRAAAGGHGGLRADPPVPAGRAGRGPRTAAGGAGRLRAVPLAQVTHGAALTVEGDIPAARVHQLRAELPALTRGEGVLECAFDRYEPVTGVVPTRPRTDHNPLNREEYLQRVTRRASLTRR